jgi:hypothetical protein
MRPDRFRSIPNLAEIVALYENSFFRPESFSLRNTRVRNAAQLSWFLHFLGHAHRYSILGMTQLSIGPLKHL